MTHASSVTPLRHFPYVSPSQVKTAALDNLPYAQMAKKYFSLLQHLAGPLAPRVYRVFGNEYAPLYILTDPARRQVWNACLAADYPDGDLSWLRQNFLMERSKDLLEDAYGSVPDGFQGLLRRAGEFGHDPEYYLFWHDHLTHFPEDFAYISGRLEICGGLTKTLMNMPAPLRRLRIYKRFNSMQDMTDFITAMTAVHDGTPSDDVWHDIREKLYAGQSPLKMLRKITDATEFPPPFITGDARFRHLGSVKAMKAASLKFKNCLGSAFSLKDAARGEDQYYEFCDGDDPLIVAITSDAPFGYTIDEILAAQNKRPSPDLKKNVEAALLEHGITRRKGVFDIVEDWEERHDPSDDFGMFQL